MVRLVWPIRDGFLRIDVSTSAPLPSEAIAGIASLVEAGEDFAQRHAPSVEETPK